MITPRDIAELEANPCWVRFVDETTTRLTLAQGVRDSPACARDTERLHLGIVMAYRESLGFVATLKKEQTNG